MCKFGSPSPAEIFAIPCCSYFLHLLRSFTRSNPSLSIPPLPYHSGRFHARFPPHFRRQRGKRETVQHPTLHLKRRSSTNGPHQLPQCISVTLCTRYPSRSILAERIKTEDTVGPPLQPGSVVARCSGCVLNHFSAALVSHTVQVEIEYVEDDKPSTKQLLCLRAPTSAAAAAVHTAIREIRSGCSGAASQFGAASFVCFLCVESLFCCAWFCNSLLQAALGTRLLLRLLCMW